MNPTGVGTHLYFLAFTVLTVLTFGGGWAFIPLTIGFLALLGASA